MEWTKLARSFALRYNPALQPRALVVLGCLCRSVNDNDIKQLLALLVQAIKRHDNCELISAISMALTRLQPLLPHDSIIHRYLFWVAIIILQLDVAQLYEDGLALLEQCFHTMDSHGIFEYEVGFKLNFVLNFL